jgi:RNA polymerase-associated protein LEO1
MLVRAVGQKHNKVARLRMAPDPTTDPEREKMELIKQSAKKSKRKTDMDDGLGGGRRKRAGYPRKRTGHDVWSDDEHEERQGSIGSDEEDEDGTSGQGSSPRKRHATIDEKKGVGEYQEDDFVVADSSDEEAKPEGESEQKRKKRAREDDYMEEDPLEKLDAKIKEQEDEKRRRRHSGETPAEAETEGGDEADQEMDVESEEDEEEEFKVRRVGGTGGKKKRAIDFDNDEDE